MPTDTTDNRKPTKPQTRKTDPSVNRATKPGIGNQTTPATTRRRAQQAAAFDLHAHLPHLLRRAHFEAEARFEEVYGSAATSRQMALLVALAQAPGATQAEVARSIGLDANTCSDLVRRTCAKGLIERRRGHSDARVYELELSAKGRAYVFESALPLAEPYSQRIAERLTAKQRQTLARLLRLLLGLHVGSKVKA